MKRPLLLLALPLVLAALVFGVKWRADHPTPTKRDLEIRALLMQCSTIEIDHFSRLPNRPRWFSFVLSKEEFEPFIHCFNLSPVQIKTYGKTGASGSLAFECTLPKPREDLVEIVGVGIDIDSREGKTGVCCRWSSEDREKILHPVTGKRWIELLLANPRIGPELRARLNP